MFGIVSHSKIGIIDFAQGKDEHCLDSVFFLLRDKMNIRNTLNVLQISQIAFYVCTHVH